MDVILLASLSNRVNSAVVCGADVDWRISGRIQTPEGEDEERYLHNGNDKMSHNTKGSDSFWHCRLMPKTNKHDQAPPEPHTSLFSVADG